MKRLFRGEAHRPYRLRYTLKIFNRIGQKFCPMTCLMISCPMIYLMILSHPQSWSDNESACQIIQSSIRLS
ncbi:MAG: hypothetical protein LBJ00_18090 [Planctomycetaceae bacterium]|nr:hypothetical protein [Planctomycetaceae bacterium]